MKKHRKRRNGSRRRPRKDSWDDQIRREAEDVGAEPSKDTREDTRLENELNRLVRDVSTG